jgi:ferritin
MAAYLETLNFPGFAHWMRLQSEEERGHAMRLFEHLIDRGATVELGGIAAPPADFGTPLQVFEAGLEHERKVTGQINRIYEIAAAAKDYPAQVMLQWFITEQVEEEKSAEDVIQQLRMVGDSPAGLIMLDKQLGARSGGH